MSVDNEIVIPNRNMDLFQINLVFRGAENSSGGYDSGVLQNTNLFRKCGDGIDMESRLLRSRGDDWPRRCFDGLLGCLSNGLGCGGHDEDGLRSRVLRSRMTLLRDSSEPE